ncbi:hypothetical protein [Undibacterium sp. Ren11W]|uniref:hypothetical protein n=1 Tax=Undibacterium sp. Ren11W TaxID=3413045 RepID=UPI003BF3B819
MYFGEGEHGDAELNALLRNTFKTKEPKTLAVYRFVEMSDTATPAANDPIYPVSDQEPANPDHSGANKSAKRNYFLLFFTILLKRYFWHAIAIIAALLLGFVAFRLLVPQCQSSHSPTLS